MAMVMFVMFVMMGLMMFGRVMFALSACGCTENAFNKLLFGLKANSLAIN